MEGFVNRFNQKLLIEAGLLVSSENGQIYDRFEVGYVPDQG
jgi:DNA primase